MNKAIMRHGRKSQRTNLRYRHYEDNRRKRIISAALDRKFKTREPHYMLRGKEIVATHRLIRWAQWFEHNRGRIGEDTINGVRVSTVFLGLDHGSLRGHRGLPPILFETMIFGGDRNNATWRYATWDEARAGHLARVKELEDALPQASAS